MDVIKLGFLEHTKYQDFLDKIGRRCGDKEQQKFAKYLHLEDYKTDDGELRCKYKA